MCPIRVGSVAQRRLAVLWVYTDAVLPPNVPHAAMIYVDAPIQQVPIAIREGDSAQARGLVALVLPAPF